MMPIDLGKCIYTETAQNMIDITEFTASLELARQMGLDERVDWLANWAVIELQQLQLAYPNIKKHDVTANIPMYGHVVNPNSLLRRYFKLMYGLSYDDRISILAGALFYMYEAMARKVYIDSQNFGKLLIGALLLAMKMECDKPYDNLSFAFLADRLSVVTINKIERMFLGACFITKNEFTPNPPKDAHEADAWQRWVEDNPFPVNYYASPIYTVMRLKIEYLFQGAIIHEVDN